MIKENFLYYIWKLKKFDLSDLKTTEGKSLHIREFGNINSNSGPDINNCKILIDDTLWVGNVEIHVKSSDWIKHNHHLDPNYQNVILHVVFENDILVKDKFGNLIPCLELKDRIGKKEITNYKLLSLNKDWIPCSRFIASVSNLSKVSALEKALINRLLMKSMKLNEQLLKYSNDWNAVFYIFLSRYFGFNVNNDAFEMLAHSIDYKIIQKENDDLFKIEALFFGQAGFLVHSLTDEYYLKLRAEYSHLQNKYQLKTLPVSLWKFSKLHPPNFPTIRIAQLANLLFLRHDIFSTVINASGYKDLVTLLDVNASDYWTEHFTFGKKSVKKIKKLGKSSIDLLIINVVVPAVFYYGVIKSEEIYKERALNFLLEMKPESNSILTKWSSLGMNIDSAYASQALLGLKKDRCERFECLECPIGYEIMNRDFMTN